MWFLEKNCVFLDLKKDISLTNKYFLKKLRNSEKIHVSASFDTHIDKDFSDKSVDSVVNQSDAARPEEKNLSRDVEKKKVSKTTKNPYHFNFKRLDDNLLDYGEYSNAVISPLLALRYNDIFNTYQIEILVETIVTDLNPSLVKQLLVNDDLLRFITIQAILKNEMVKEAFKGYPAYQQAVEDLEEHLKNKKEKEMKYAPQDVIFVSGIAFGVTEADLSALFSLYGEVLLARILTPPVVERNNGNGFIMMNSLDSQDEAINGLNETVFKGSVLHLKKAKIERI